MELLKPMQQAVALNRKVHENLIQTVTRVTQQAQESGGEIAERLGVPEPVQATLKDWGQAVRTVQAEYTKNVKAGFQRVEACLQVG